LYSSPSIIRMIKSTRMRWAGHIGRIEMKRNAYRLSVEKPEGWRTLGRPSRRCVDNIKLDLGEIDWGCMDWIYLAQDSYRWRARLSSVMIFRVL
jgi:hypothetical protein